MSDQEYLQDTSSRGLKFRPIPFALLALLIVFLLYQLIGGGITLFLFGEIPAASQTLAFRLITMVAEFAFILVPALLLTKIQSKDWKHFLRYKKTDWYFIGLAVVGVISLQQLLELYLYLQSLIPLSPTVKEAIRPFQKAIDHTYAILLSAHSPSDFLFVLAVIAVTPAICEETLFRGLVQANFESSLPKWSAIIWTGVIFGAYHLDPFSFVALASLGIYLSYLVSATGSIVVPMVAHFTNNFLSALIYYLWKKDSLVAPSGDTRVSVAYIIEWSIVLVLIFGMTVYLTSNHNKLRQEANQP
ncbi:MAG: CPBP family intramembrane metalloprotease [Bacteroidetes bacterium]|nr:CPBP family intramembrane metalloprotease [Bacteroidota bacterium]